MESNDMVTVLRHINDATDEQCRQIFDAANARIRTLRDQRDREARANLSIGDVVTTGAGLSPRYLSGLPGKITGRRGDKLVVTIDESHRWLLRRYHYELALPAGAINKIGVPA